MSLEKLLEDAKIAVPSRSTATDILLSFQAAGFVGGMCPLAPSTSQNCHVETKNAANVYYLIYDFPNLNILAKPLRRI